MHLLVGTAAPHTHAHLDVVPHKDGVVVIAQEVSPLLEQLAPYWQGNLKCRSKILLNDLLLTYLGLSYVQHTYNKIAD